VKLTRRELIRTGATAGALLVARPALASAATRPRQRSRLFPGSRSFVVDSDLHNHTLLSDGATKAEDAFVMMRDARLDVAAITDHAILGKKAGEHFCNSQPCTVFVGINEQSWKQMRAVADAKHRDGSFVAMRGFEWSTGTIGHVNVWFTENWVDTLETVGAQSPKGISQLFNQVGPLQEPGRAVTPTIDDLPETAIMDVFYDWLAASPDRPVLGGGADGIAGFNHPNQYGNFRSFEFFPSLVDRMVSCEALNGFDDYLFWGTGEGQPCALNACLNAGWRVGMLGVSDEHKMDWKKSKARAGLWVDRLTRDGVRRALVSRRFFATYEKGLRFDAIANGIPMGGRLSHRKGIVRFALDIDKGPAWYGRPLNVQVLRPGSNFPVVADSFDIAVPTPRQPVIRFTVPVDRGDGDWILVRVTDPATVADARAPRAWTGFGRTVAYASPFFLS
jgi:hypothetical protein